MKTPVQNNSVYLTLRGKVEYLEVDIKRRFWRIFQPLSLSCQNHPKPPTRLPVVKDFYQDFVKDFVKDFVQVLLTC